MHWSMSSRRSTALSAPCVCGLSCVSSIGRGHCIPCPPYDRQMRREGAHVNGVAPRSVPWGSKLEEVLPKGHRPFAVDELVQKEVAAAIPDLPPALVALTMSYHDNVPLNCHSVIAQLGTKTDEHYCLEAQVLPPVRAPTGNGILIPAKVVLNGDRVRTITGVEIRDGELQVHVEGAFRGRGHHQQMQRRQEEHEKALKSNPNAPWPFIRITCYICLPEDCPARAAYEYQPCRMRG